MKKILFSIAFLIMLTSIASAEILINQQPEALYNLGDVVNLPLKIVASEDIAQTFNIKLICGGTETEVFAKDIILESGEEEAITAKIILTKERAKISTCKVKSTLGEEYELTSEFKVSNLIVLSLDETKAEFLPEQELIIKGEATKENKEAVEKGFVTLTISNNDLSENIEITDTITNGYFELNYTFPKDTKAGKYTARIKAYEKEKEETTNNGETAYSLNVLQVPTSLEIIFENSEVEPGTNLQVKAVLHDQSGENINSVAIISIKNNKNKVLEQTEKVTDTYLEFPISETEEPEEWNVVAVSNKLKTEATFKIKVNKAVDVLLVNNTIIISNKGNIFYNDSVLVKIGNETININTSLDVGEFQEYVLTAPEGKYKIEVVADGENKVTDSIALTGNAIDVKKASSVAVKVLKHPIVWIFLIAVLGFATYIFLKKGYKKTLFGGKLSKKKVSLPQIKLKKSSPIISKNKAELALSIKGDRQTADIICLKIKNLNKIEESTNNSKEIIQKLVNLAETNKAFTYENKEDFFFILAPVKTKTFKNEKNVIKLSQQMQRILENHNRLFKQKIDFGIALTQGTIIAKQEKDTLKFMCMGNLIPLSKKIAGFAEQEILLGEEFSKKLGSEIKTEKQTKEKTNIYRIKEIRNIKEHKKFLSNFIKRLEGEKKSK